MTRLMMIWERAKGRREGFEIFVSLASPLRSLYLHMLGHLRGRRAWVKFTSYILGWQICFESSVGVDLACLDIWGGVSRAGLKM
jgi:hypothetical protein